MAVKLVDYLISGVRYDETQSHIDSVRVHQDQGDTIGPMFNMTRLDVVQRLGIGQTFMTIYPGQEGNWTRGARVEPIVIGGVTYIRTDPDAIEADNLGDLPRY